MKLLNLLLLILLLLTSCTHQLNRSYIPKSSGEIVHHTDYSLAYSEEHEQPYWVYYQLELKEVNGSAERTDDFREDPLVSTGSNPPEPH